MDYIYHVIYTIAKFATLQVKVMILSLNFNLTYSLEYFPFLCFSSIKNICDIKIMYIYLIRYAVSFYLFYCTIIYISCIYMYIYIFWSFNFSISKYPLMLKNPYVFVWTSRYVVSQTLSLIFVNNFIFGNNKWFILILFYFSLT